MLGNIINKQPHIVFDALYTLLCPITDGDMAHFQSHCRNEEVQSTVMSMLSELGLKQEDLIHIEGKRKEALLNSVMETRRYFVNLPDMQPRELPASVTTLLADHEAPGLNPRLVNRS